MMALKQISVRTTWFLCVLVSIVLLMPYTTQGYIVMAICTICVILLTKSRVTNAGFLMLFYFVLCFFFNNAITGGENTVKDILNALAIFLLVGFRPNVNTKGLEPAFILILLCCILFSQFIVSMQIRPWSQMIADLYFDEDARSYGSVMSMAEIINGANARAGGFLGNPNQCAKIVNLIFAAYMARNIKKRIFYPLWIVYILIIAYAGSRTGMLVSAVLFLYFLYHRYKDKIDIVKFPFIAAFAVAVLVLVVHYIKSHFADMRMFDIESGMETSLGVKWDVIEGYLIYLEQTNGYLYALFGNFFNSNSPDLIVKLGIPLGFFDSDLGYLFYSYGIVGMFLIIYCLIKQFAICKISNIFWILLLWITTASVFMHFKFVLLFSMILRMSANTKLDA